MANNNKLLLYRLGVNQDAIVDIKITSSGAEDVLLHQMGYELIKPENKASDSRAKDNFLGTFGKGQSMWIWRRKQGVFSGRMKSIVDIMLSREHTSSLFVLNGYTRLLSSVSGQFIWIKRALTIDEDIDNAIIDINVVYNLLDPDYIAGTGWVSIAGNFNKKNVLYTQTYTRLSYMPSKFRPTKQMIKLQKRENKSSKNNKSNKYELIDINTRENSSIVYFFSILRMAFRNYLPDDIISKCAPTQHLSPNSDDINNYNFKDTDREYDFSTLFREIAPKGKLYMSDFKGLLNKVGIFIHSEDVYKCFYLLNAEIDNYICREEFENFMMLTDYEIDLLIDEIRYLIVNASPINEKNNNSDNDCYVSSYNDNTSSNSSITTAVTLDDHDSRIKINRAREDSLLIPSFMAVKIPTEIKYNLRQKQFYSNVFRDANENDDNIISSEELLQLISDLG